MSVFQNHQILMLRISSGLMYLDLCMQIVILLCNISVDILPLFQCNLRSTYISWNYNGIPLVFSGIALFFQWNSTDIPVEFWNIPLLFRWNINSMTVEYCQEFQWKPVEFYKIPLKYSTDVQWNTTEKQWKFQWNSYYFCVVNIIHFYVLIAMGLEKQWHKKCYESQLWLASWQCSNCKRGNCTHKFISIFAVLRRCA